MTWGISIITTIENGHFFLRDSAAAAAAAHDFLWEETKRFGSLQKPVQHFYLEVQLNYQGAFAYLSLLKVNYLFS